VGERENLSGRSVGEFVLRERIGEGGFGAVYRCEQPLLGREAVVKVLHRRLRHDDVILRRFMREAQLASRLDHPYAAHVYAFGIEPDDGLFWIAMEMVQGTTLTRWLRERGPLPLDQFVPFFERVAEVVQTAHDCGIVHRDLTPSNVMVVERAGRLLPKLLDFGIAKLLDEAAAARPLSPPGLPLPSRTGPHDLPEAPEQPGPWLPPSNTVPRTGSTARSPRHGQPRGLTDADATMGSPPYMSPEQWSNAVTVGTRADLYALGVVAYEVLTGHKPFNATTRADYVELHCNAPVPPLGDGFSPAFDRLFERALAKRPEDRWDTALELAAAFRVASGLGIAADLPRLDEAVRDAWLADAPQPLAESVAALDSARNAHQARDAAQELVRTLVRYLVALALATRAQVRDERGDPELLELVRAMRRRDLRDDERVQLLRLLVRPLASRRGAHPIPELVDLVTPRADDGADELDLILAAQAESHQLADDDIVRLRLARLVPELAHLLRKLAFVLDYALVVPRNQAAERWTGLRRQHRALATIHTGELVDHHPMLLDRNARICVDLWPVMQAVSPTEGAEPELFLFDGRGRHGARMIAAPAGFEHHDPGVWEWLAAHVMAEDDANPEITDAGQPPYLGLTPFSTSDAARFVGREWEVDGFLNRLRQRALQVVVGPSGAGKSSFVHAGVIPGLPPSWRTVTMRPGSAPISTLAARLSAANITAADLRPILETSPAAAAALVAHAAASGTIVIVIDQLEELFTLCTNADERLQFAAVIAQLAAAADAPVRVICTIRDDFLMQLDALAPMRPLLSPALVLLGNPSRDALVRIIVEPARRAGYALSDPGLAQDMVNAVADRPGALALVSFTASRLWALRDRRFRQLTRNAYDAMGGVGGALGRHAEATLDQLSADEQRFVREIFRHLITAEGTRARLTAKELRQRVAAPGAAVIDKLVAARLIALSESDGESHVEVTHDALLGAWPRLQQWVSEDVDGARMRDQIRASARQWHDRGRPRGLLWRDEVLADLERWLRRGGPIALSELEAGFVEASRRYTRRATRVRRVLALVALGVAFAFAMVQCRAAQRSEIDHARVTQSDIERGGDALIEGKHTEALLYLAEAFRRGNDSPILSFMLVHAAQPFLAERARLTSTSGRVWSAMFSRDGRRIVTTDDGGARLWDARTHRLLHLLPHAEPVYDAAFSSDGQRLVTAGADGFVKIWAAETGALVHALTHDQANGQAPSYGRVVVAGDGRLVAASDVSGAFVHVWDASTGGVIAVLPSLARDNPSLAFSQDGHWLATSGGDDVQVFDTGTWRSVLTLAGPQVSSVSFDPTGPRIATASRLGDTSIWAIPSGERLHHLHETGDKIDHIAYSPDGAFVVTASRDGAERVWNTRTGGLQAELKNHRGMVSWAEFDPTSKLVVSAGADGVVAISEVATGVPISVLEGARSLVAVVHFDPTSRTVIGASWDGVARIWDAGAPYRRWSSPPSDVDCDTGANLDEDQRFLAISCKNRGTYVWDTAHDQLLATLPNVTPVSEFASASPAISAPGDRVAIAAGNTVVIYQLPGGRPVRTITHPAAVRSVAFAKSGHDLVSSSVDGSLLVTRDGRDPLALSVFPGGSDVVGFTPDGRVLAAGSRRQLRVYDPERNALLAELEAPVPIRAFRSSSDGHRLITIPTTKTPLPPVLWDLGSYRIIAKLEGHQGQVFSVRFVNGDRELLSAGTDGAARLWDGMTGRLRQTYFGSSGFLLDAVLDPDGSTVVTAGSDGVLRFWDPSSGRMIWTLHVHGSIISGVHFEGIDIVTRGFNGELARWRLPKVPASQDLVRMIGRVVPCLPFRFDEDTGRLVKQDQECKTAMDSTPH
jgi:WD40 repeat protein/serine/threonine protein kinase